MFNLQDKTAIITGAGSGIGRAIAMLFAQQNAKVIAVDLNGDALEETLQLIKEKGSDARVEICNVSDQEIVLETFGRIQTIDILVNSAGVSHIGKADTTLEADFDRLYQVNVKGVYNCIYGALPLMKEKGGSIINIASVAGTVGIPERFAYSMTKGAVLAMTLSIARDYLKENIRANSISPGRVHTPFVDNFLAKNYPGKEQEMFEKLSKTQPIGRMGRPDEIAALALYLCSDEAAFITGSDYPIDGGFITLNN